MKPKPTLLANDFMKPWWMKNKKRLVAYKEYIEANERAKCGAEIAELNAEIAGHMLSFDEIEKLSIIGLKQEKELKLEIATLRMENRTKEREVKRLVTEIAQLKELVREQRATFSKNCLKGFATMCRKCYKDDEVGGCERKRWLAKAKQALGEGKK